MNDLAVLKKEMRAFDLALAAGRKRQSPRTKMVHLFPEEDQATDTIPLYENFCFAFALFRQKTAEHVAEGKELIEKLLAFQTPGGNFPLYLHDYPRCWDPCLALKIAPIFIQLLRLFGAVLSAEFKEKIEASLEKMLDFASKRHQEHPFSPLCEDRLRACTKQPLQAPIADFSAQEWAEFILTSQVLDPTCQSFPIPYNSQLQLFTGNPKGAVQERAEPRPLPIEWLLAEKEGRLTPRLLKDHPHQILCAAFLPFETTLAASSPYTILPGHPFRLIWEGASLHSLTLRSASRWEVSLTGVELFIDLKGDVEIGRESLWESLLFCDFSGETEIFVEGKKATLFRLGDLITIQTPHTSIQLVFTLREGDGDFCGHISRGNRPEQIACKGPLLYEAFDWRIGLRTLRRQGNGQISASIRIPIFV
jgi:hypothetical protein